MVQVLAVLVGLASVGISFFSPPLAWVLLLVAAAALLLTLFGVKRQGWRHIEELSPQANAMLQRFGAYYSMPFAGRDFSAATSTIQLAAVAVGVVGLFHGFWLGVVPAAAFWFALGPTAMAFNPTEFIRGTPLEAAHDEVIQWIRDRTQTKTTGPT